ncbi:15-methylpalmitoyl-4-hydroxy-2-pyrone synthase [Desmospora activa DSM 45169]|uniref:15-methylpalmitoyl-4-hydroxy-2-pyrone synthase n=2 Tax=Desmospora TaxID=500614 RepID=A0A2T4Z6X2_9BACL|nr:15-methylpalmitoyl-4-hydroxy-2-pyrone synthase [Desmospora activa DSM 45169]
MPRILAVGTAVPEYELNQHEARQFAYNCFHDSFSDIERYLPIFDHAAIQTRRFSRPRTWFEQEHGFAERNRIYTEVACHLGEEAIRRCLQAVELSATDVDHLIVVSTSGLATPSLDARLMNQLEFQRHIKRTPIWGLGCAGGAVGLSRAYEYARAFPDSMVVLLAVELCSLTFRRRDHSKSNLVATSLFADGAAAVLVAGDQVSLPHSAKRYPRVVDAMSTTWPDSLDVMGWDVVDDGLKVVFSRDIPAIVQREVRPAVEAFLERSGLSLGRLQRIIAHPGGAKVLAAYEEALELRPQSMHHSRTVLNQYGNMSSATVLFVLERELQESHQAGTVGLLTALGPGFSSELMLLEWD